ncbi:MAG: hypothetical protein KDD11_20035, partial [Acidobacteria bacterium]|nr:hypothetical protein [Acidobacteriota bacterium]
MRHQAALVRSLLVVTLLGSGWSTAMAQDAASEADAQGRVRSPNNPMVTLAEVQTRRPPAPRPPSGAAVFPEEFRSIDGTGNNAENPTWGSTGIPFLRLTTASYGDGASSLAGRNLASARAVSNAVVAQTASTPNALGVSDFVWQWGQFVDHDIDLTPESSPAEPADIAVPSGDEWFDPSATGTATIAMNRSLYEDVDGVRQQINTISAFIDGSNVYG